ncbi:MAG: class I SAM-dependent methyltransferase [Deltaproteobacteria bacterium]|nr:class I SAM-dependent methyltransferase [Deltaproteobacteria bacterium]
MATYRDELLRQTFGQVQQHRLVGDIVKRFSDNRSDIYELALKDTSFDRPIKVLDIGCGYGRFTSHLRQRVPAGSRCTGLDLLMENRQPFINTARHINLEADFINGPATRIEVMPDNSYDLIITAYSLNFFSAIIPQLARVLMPDGYLIIINHSRNFLNELVQDISLALSHSTIAGQVRRNQKRLIFNFNDENGISLLSPHFKTINYMDYENRLSFPLSELDCCFIYIDFKLPLLIPMNHHDTDFDLTRFRKTLFQRIRQGSKASGFYRMNKNDCIFRCSQPVKGDSHDDG